VREIIHETDPEIVERWKWVKPTSPGTPVWSHGGVVCTGETYKNHVKMTFAKGVALKDPFGLFNSSLDGNVRRAIDIHEGDNIDEAAFKDLIGAAVALNLKSKSNPKSPPASSKRVGYLHRRSRPYPLQGSVERYFADWSLRSVSKHVAEAVGAQANEDGLA